jgi:hypothetical protein
MTTRKFITAYLLAAVSVSGLIAILPGPLSEMVAEMTMQLLAWSFAAFFVLGFLACVVTILASLFRT